MASSQIKTVGIIGTGVIGCSWTTLFLANGLKVIVTDPADGAEARLKDYLQRNISIVPNAKLDVTGALKNLTFTKDIDPYLAGIDLIQENGPEKLEFKQNLFAHLDANTPEHALLTSSSSGIPSSQFMTCCKRNPARILIGHPYNPPHLLPLVEVVPHPGTGEQYVKAAIQFYKDMGKDPILVKKEEPGFIANRLQEAVLSESYSLITRGVVSAEDLDKTVTSGMGLRWAMLGPVMTNTLGGGRSFPHFIDHLGPAMKVWQDDMNVHQFKFQDPQQISELKSKVNEWVSHVNMERVEGAMDTFLAELVKFKAKSPLSQL